jgi:predicted PolB exonuclease-like 3'-5' exonuclease
MNMLGESDGKSVVIGELESDVVQYYAMQKQKNRKGSGYLDSQVQHKINVDYDA